MEERQTNYTIAESYELPSKGLIYDKPVASQVELRSMTARDEMKRLNHSAAPYKTLADIIEGCMIEKPVIHVYDMALGDYEFLLHKLRIASYGPDYKTELVCPYCGKPVSVTLQLDALELKDFDISEFKELATFTLPKSGKVVSLAYQTPHTLDNIESRSKEMRRKMKTADTDFDTLNTLLEAIETVDGAHLDSFSLENFIIGLPAADMYKILLNIRKMNECIGINTSDIHVDCPLCGGDIQTFFQFGPEFFRPTNL